MTNLNNNFRIVSYYTLGTPYVQVAQDHIIKSLKVFPTLKTDIRGVNNLGSWQANTVYKPKFLLEMLELYPNENIVFVDCDAEILEFPDLFNKIHESYNVACHYLDRETWYKKSYPEGQKKELLSGTLFLRNNQQAKEIVYQWYTKAYANNIWEQKVLQKTISEKNIPVFELPIEYCWIKSLPNGDLPHVTPKSPIVIRHNQVSRLFKRNLN